MKIAREGLIDHLQRIHCGGLLPDIAMDGQFVATGASVDRQMLVMTGGLAKADPLSEEVGITNLELFIKVLKSMIDDDVALTFERPYIVVAAHDRTFRLITSEPRVLGTRIDEAFKAKVLALIPADTVWHSLEHRFVDGVTKTITLLKAEIATLHVGKTGSQLEVGDPKINAASFDLPDIKSDVEYKLLLSAEKLKPVLEQLGDFTKAQIAVTGPDSIVGIREGTYVYIISPDEDKKK